MRPVDSITLDEASHIIGCSLRTLHRHIEAGRLPHGPKNQKRRVSRADTEALALQLRSSRVPFDPDTSCWIGASAAAGIPGANVTGSTSSSRKGRHPLRDSPTAGASTGESNC
jgi:hypothetical protein